MKIKRTSNRGMTQSKVHSKSQKQSNNSRKEVGDVVSLSEDAIAALTSDRVEKVSQRSSIDEALPDPRATSQAILEKELARVFREIYL